MNTNQTIKTKDNKNKYFTFVVNNYTEQDEKTVQLVALLKTVYTIYGREIGENGTPHLQGFLITRVPMRFQTISKLLPRAHIEIAKKCALANFRYCSKSGDYWIHCDPGYSEDGKPLKEKASKINNQTLDEAYELAKEGKFMEISKKHWLKYHKEFEQIYIENKKPEDLILSNGSLSFFKNHFLWLQGPTGVGKSYHCKMIEYILDCFYTKYKHNRDIRYIPQCFMKTYKKNINKWWDNYSLEDIVLLEEMDPERAKYMAGFLKIWCDQYTFPVEVKGSSLSCIRPKFIIVTSNYRLRDCFPNINDYEPLERRFSQINITSVNEPINWPNLNGLKTEWDLAYHFKKEEQKRKQDLFNSMMDGVNLDIIEEPLPKLTDTYLGKKAIIVPSNDNERITQECFTPEQELEIQNNYQEPPKTPPLEPGFTKQELMEMKNLDKNDSFAPFPAPPSEFTQPDTPTVILVNSDDESEEQPKKKNKGKEPATDEDDFEDDSSLNLNIIRDNLNYISDYIYNKELPKRKHSLTEEEAMEKIGHFGTIDDQLNRIGNDEETPSKKQRTITQKNGKKKQPTMEETVYKKRYGYYED